MCKAFCFLLTRDGRVYGELGFDSHDALWTKYHKDDPRLADFRYLDKEELDFVRGEIAPQDDAYFDANAKWTLTLDEECAPNWYNASFEPLAWRALDRWRKSLYSVLDVAKLRCPDNPLSPDAVCHKATEADAKLLRAWASIAPPPTAVSAERFTELMQNLLERTVGINIVDSITDVANDLYYAVLTATFQRFGYMCDELLESTCAVATWAYVGSLVHGAWPDGYPYAAAAELWRHGFVPIQDGDDWYLVSGPNSRVVWAGTREYLLSEQ